jgi:hypothetical protein
VVLVSKRNKEDINKERQKGREREREKERKEGNGRKGDNDLKLNFKSMIKIVDVS